MTRAGPMNLGDILDRAVTLVVRCAPVLIVIGMLLYAIPGTIMDGIIRAHRLEGAMTRRSLFALKIIIEVPWFCAHYAVLISTMNGTRLTLKAALRSGFRNLFAVGLIRLCSAAIFETIVLTATHSTLPLWSALVPERERTVIAFASVFALAIVLCALACALYLGVAVAFAAAVMIVVVIGEGANVGEAVRRGLGRLLSRPWTAATLALCASLPYIAMLIAMATGRGLHLSRGTPAGDVILVMLDAVAGTFFAAVVVAFNEDVRIRREGIDLVRRIDGRRPGT